jgi:hypothetical protein
MAYRKLLIGLLCVLVPMGATAQRQEPKKDWPIGTWVLCEDPDNSPKDSPLFKSDGTGAVIRAAGNIEFLHKHSGQSVSLLANAKGYAIPIELSASSAFDRLLLYSDKTGNTASYVKSDSSQAGDCGIK